MKVCPECHARFDAGETFCPNDGTELVAARLLSPGSLTGTALEDVVRLERVEFTDRLGERYAGRLVVSRKPVYVIVFNQAFEPSDLALERVETARAKVGSPLPPEINTLLQGGLDGTPPYLIESGPRGPSLRGLLEQKRVLDWRTAARITCSAARAVQWLGHQGHVHYLLHDGSLHVTNLNKGRIQLGEWTTEQLIGELSPLEAATGDPERFVGFTPYMAPELAGDLGGGDLRSAVYALGVLLYEMLVGKPPFVSKAPAETLRRHIQDQPIKASVARSGGEIHPELDDLVEMMLAKDPDKRFQAPAAIIAVLANLLDESPDEVAPPLERAESMEEEDIYATIEMSQVDRDALPPRPVEGSEDDDDALEPGADAQPSVVVSPEISEPHEPSDELSEGSGIFRKSPGLAAAASQASEATEEPDEEAHPHPGQAVVEEASETEPGADGPKKTLLMGSIRVEDIEAASDRVEAADEAEEEKEEAAVEPDAAGEEEKREREEDREAELVAPTSKIVIDSGFAAEADVKVERAAEAQAEDEARDGADAGATAVSDPEPEPERKPRKGGMEIGFVEVDTASAPPANDWFSRSTEEAWESSLALEYQESSERRWRTIGIGLAVVLAVAALGLILYFEFGGEPVDEQAEGAEVAAAEVLDGPEVDVEQLRNNFDDAMEGGRVIAPVGNSAVSYLEQLRRYAAGEAAYEEARSAFVARARREAEALDGAGELRQARALAGYASQFAPEDAELRAMVDDLQARYLGTTPDGLGAEAEAADSDAADPQAAPSEPTSSAEKPAPAVSTRALVSQARAAYSRGQLDEAQRLYEDALRREADDPAIHAGIGQVYFDRAAYPKAVEHLGRAVRLEPGRADYRISLGQAYYRLERYGDAISAWEVVLERDPNNRNARQYIELARGKLD